MEAIAVIDRPFAGYLFWAAEKTFLQNESVYKVGVELGFVGTNSFARRNTRFHKFLSYKSVYGWETQVTIVLVQSHFVFQ
jgi:hypothetical protein